MNRFKLCMLSAVAGCTMLAFAPLAIAQDQAPTTRGVVSLNAGMAPACPYGYYDSTPYSCAPYGYYSPKWFADGAFMGAGPWFHGPDNFRGSVDNRLIAANGYTGKLPQPGDKADPANALGHVDTDQPAAQ
jgi:hypothetical protein